MSEQVANCMVTRTYKWSIEAFNLENLKNKPLVSKLLHYNMDLNSEVEHKSSWSLNLYPNGFDDESKGYVCFEIALRTYDGSDIKIIEVPSLLVDCKLSILKENGEETNSHYAKIHLDDEDTVLAQRLFRNFMKLDSILNSANGLLTNDELTLLFSIGVQEGQSVITTVESTYKSRLQLSDNFECFYSSKKFTDVTLIVGDKEFQANKIILAAHSPVFSSMFSLDMKEKKNDSVKIDDVDPKVFKEMLKFMYTGKLQKYQLVEELLVVADKYAVEGLQEVCEKYLRNNVRTDNAMDILQLADSYNAYDLKQYALDYIVRYAQYVIKTDGFKNMQQPQVHLIKELFCALTEHERN